jgi:serine/threonine protein kinase
MNILHRDFGSRNLLIKEGHIKITDFGLARKLQGGQECYQPSTVCGTLPWMAPEQVCVLLLIFYAHTLGRLDVYLHDVMFECFCMTVLRLLS